MSDKRGEYIKTVHENECHIIGQMLIDDKVYFNSGVRLEHFTSLKGKALYQAYSSLIEEGTRPDINNLAQACPSVEAYEVARLTDIPTAANYEHYAKLVIEAGTKDRIWKMLQKANENIGKFKSDEMLSKLQRHIDDISAIQVIHDIKSAKEIIPDFMNETEKRYQNRGQKAGIETGFTGIDNATQGFKNQDYIIIGARPSDGKTALMVNICMNMAMNEIPVGFITTESSEQELILRGYSGISRINSQSLMSGYVTKDDFSELTKISGSLYEKPLYIYDEPNANIKTVCLIARRMTKYNKIKCLFVDYIQNIEPANTRIPRHEQVSSISKTLKTLSRQLGIPVVVASQLKRPSDHKPRPPVLSDLGETKQLEQDGDIIIMIHHDMYVQEGQDKIESSKLYIRKQRNGPTPVIPVEWEPHFVSFSNKVEKMDVTEDGQGELL